MGIIIPEVSKYSGIIFTLTQIPQNVIETKNYFIFGHSLPKRTCFVLHLFYVKM